jgi:hypothetical protein
MGLWVHCSVAVECAVGEGCCLPATDLTVALSVVLLGANLYFFFHGSKTVGQSGATADASWCLGGVACFWDARDLWVMVEEVWPTFKQWREKMQVKLLRKLRGERRGDLEEASGYRLD